MAILNHLGNEIISNVAGKAKENVVGQAAKRMGGGFAQGMSNIGSSLAGDAHLWQSRAIESAVTGATIGAAVGGVSGAMSGEGFASGVGRGAIRGAVLGGAWGVGSSFMTNTGRIGGGWHGPGGLATKAKTGIDNFRNIYQGVDAGPKIGPRMPTVQGFTRGVNRASFMGEQGPPPPPPRTAPSPPIPTNHVKAKAAGQKAYNMSQQANQNQANKRWRIHTGANTKNVDPNVNWVGRNRNYHHDLKQRVNRTVPPVQGDTSRPISFTGVQYGPGVLENRAAKAAQAADQSAAVASRTAASRQGKGSFAGPQGFRSQSANRPTQPQVAQQQQRQSQRNIENAARRGNPITGLNRSSVFNARRI